MSEVLWGRAWVADGFGMLLPMKKTVTIIGAGLAGSEAALQLADRGFSVRLLEARPLVSTPVHKTSNAAELVCSNSLKSVKPSSAAGMLKAELAALGSRVYGAALRHAVPAGGALAVDRLAFSADVTALLESHPLIRFERVEATDVAKEAACADAVVVAAGPLATDALSCSLASLTGSEYLLFFDAAAPVVMADSLDGDKVFRQSRYEEGEGDYLNAAFSKEEYDAFANELVAAERVIMRDFESKDLFQACQPIEEVVRSGHDAPRFGALKPVGLVDPRTGKRPWAAVQLRAEDAAGQSYNLVGFQTNLTFPEQRRVFRMIPGLEHAEFARYGVMHRNTFLDAPRLLDSHLRLKTPQAAALSAPIYVAGQISGTEGYCEAVRSGLHAACAVAADLQGIALPDLPKQTVFGALLAWATDPATKDYQPMHVNFGIMEPLVPAVRNKQERYAAYASRGARALSLYCQELARLGFLPRGGEALDFDKCEEDGFLHV